MRLPFTKMQATGNDFIILDARSSWAGPLSATDLSRRLANRHFGVGADQILFLHPSKSCDFRLQVFNADGSEAEMSGNGMRCFAKFLFDQNLISASEMKIETLAGIILARIVDGQRGAKVARVEVDMGPPHYRGRKKIQAAPIRQWPSAHLLENDDRAADAVWLHVVSMGNPHAVLLVQDVDRVPLAEWGPVIENHPEFPARTNFEIVSFGPGGQIRQRTWERGAGETLACGTGACAVAKTLFATGRIVGAVTLTLSGGQIAVQEAANGHLLQTGPAELVFVGEWCMENI